MYSEKNLRSVSLCQSVIVSTTQSNSFKPCTFDWFLNVNLCHLVDLVTVVVENRCEARSFCVFWQPHTKLSILTSLVDTSLVKYWYFAFSKVLFLQCQILVSELLRVSVVTRLCNILCNCMKKD